MYRQLSMTPEVGARQIDPPTSFIVTSSLEIFTADSYAPINAQ